MHIKIDAKDGKVVITHIADTGEVTEEEFPQNKLSSAAKYLTWWLPHVKVSVKRREGS